jgi:hypothetical protein
VSKGDDELRMLGGRTGWHFPQMPGGIYAGHYPAGSVAAIAHLEALRAQGAEFFALPSPMFWWLDHFAEFSQHLRDRYRLLRKDDFCVIYSLREAASLDTANAWPQLNEVLNQFERVYNRQPAILDWDTGLELATRLPQHTVFRPPTPNELPYLDGTIDLVAVRTPGDQELEEARRVADAGVLVFSDGGGPDGSSKDRATKDDSGLSMALAGRLRAAESVKARVVVVVPLAQDAPRARWLNDLRGGLPPDIDVEIVLTHNFSGHANGELRQLIRRTAGVTIRLYPRQPVAAMLNKAASAAKGDIVILLNSDAIPLPGWLPSLLRTFRDCQDAGAVAAKLLFPDGRLKEAGREILADGSSIAVGSGEFNCEAPEFACVREVDCASPILLATRLSTFQAVGGFDTGFESIDFAAADYCMKVRQNGQRVLWQPLSRVVVPGVDEKHDAFSRDRQIFLERWSQVPAGETAPATGSDRPKSEPLHSAARPAGRREHRGA